MRLQTEYLINSNRERGEQISLRNYMQFPWDEKEPTISDEKREELGNKLDEGIKKLRQQIGGS